MIRFSMAAADKSYREPSVATNANDNKTNATTPPVALKYDP
jgi:hypothetical protein